MKQCKGCGAYKSLAEFYPSSGKCKDCKRAAASAYYVANKAAAQERMRAHYKNNKPRYREWERRHLYGVDDMQYARMVAAQGGLCAICQRATKLVIDHDHETGAVRGLLCNICNMRVGIIENAPMVAAIHEYLSTLRSQPRKAAA